MFLARLMFPLKSTGVTWIRRKTLSNVKSKAKFKVSFRQVIYVTVSQENSNL